MAAAAELSSISQRLVVEAPAEHDLVEAARQGDEAAFRLLYRNHRADVYRAVYRILGADGDIDDVIQEVFLQVHKSLGSFRGQAKLSTWLHRVAVNVALQHIRKKKTAIKVRPVERVESHSEESAPSPHEKAETKDRMAAVVRALDKLSPKKRAVVVMHDMQGMDAKEVAKVVGAPIFTVRTRLFYGRRDLYREVLKDPAFAGDISPEELSRGR